MKIGVNAAYYCATEGIAEVPFDSWDQVEDWFIKWDCLHFCLKGEGQEWQEVDLESNVDDIIDWKRPSNATIHPVTDDGYLDWDEELAEC